MVLEIPDVFFLFLTCSLRIFLSKRSLSSWFARIRSNSRFGFLLPILKVDNLRFSSLADISPAGSRILIGYPSSRNLSPDDHLGFLLPISEGSKF